MKGVSVEQTRKDVFAFNNVSNSFLSETNALPFPASKQYRSQELVGVDCLKADYRFTLRTPAGSTLNICHNQRFLSVEF